MRRGGHSKYGEKKKKTSQANITEGTPRCEQEGKTERRKIVEKGRLCGSQEGFLVISWRIEAVRKKKACHCLPETMSRRRGRGRREKGERPAGDKKTDREEGRGFFEKKRFSKPTVRRKKIGELRREKKETLTGGGSSGGDHISYSQKNPYL